jgi:deoxycytidine triphosphate deaminase
MVTEDINWFIKQISKEEEIPDKILISPFSAECLQPASYDIRLGEEYISHMTGKKGKIDSKNKLIIKPGETVTVVSFEYIGLPQNITALVTSRMHLVMQGLTQMSTHIDPGFYGKLFQTMTNLSVRNIELRYMEPIAHLTFFRVGKAMPQQRYKGIRLGQKTLVPEELHKDAASELVRIIKDPGNPFQLHYTRTVLPIIGTIIGVASFFYGVTNSTLLYTVGGAGLILTVILSFLRRDKK